MCQLMVVHMRLWPPGEEKKAGGEFSGIRKEVVLHTGPVSRSVVLGIHPQALLLRGIEAHSRESTLGLRLQGLNDDEPSLFASRAESWVIFPAWLAGGQ